MKGKGLDKILDELSNDAIRKEKRIIMLEKEVMLLKEKLKILMGTTETEIPDKIKLINVDKIKPLNQELIIKNLSYYTLSHYLDGISGLGRFIKNIIHKNESGIHYVNYIYESGEFYRWTNLDDDNLKSKWQKENNHFLNVIVEMLRPRFKDLSQSHKKTFPDFKFSEKFLKFSKGMLECAGKNRESLLKELTDWLFEEKSVFGKKLNQKSKISYYRDDEENIENNEEEITDEDECTINNVQKSDIEEVIITSESEIDFDDEINEENYEETTTDQNTLLNEEIIKKINEKKSIPTWARP